MISFVVNAVPVAQPRARAFSIAGRPRIVSAPARHPVIDFKAACRLAATTAYNGPPLNVPLWVSLLFVMPRPGNMIWKKRSMPRVPHGKKPDLDNLMKAGLDALNGLVWRDDSLLAQVVARKVIASGDEQPRVEIEIHEFEVTHD